VVVLLLGGRRALHDGTEGAGWDEAAEDVGGDVLLFFFVFLVFVLFVDGFR
jgi:hypothetical protein